jgi:hypothetical protein
MRATDTIRRQERHQIRRWLQQCRSYRGWRQFWQLTIYGPRELERRRRQEHRAAVRRLRARLRALERTA